MTQYIRVMQYQIVKPCDDDWYSLGKILNYLQTATRQVLNKTIQLCWEWQGFGSEYHKKFGKYAVDRELLGYSVSGFCYHELRQKYPLIHSSNISQSIQRAVLRWKSDAKDVLQGEKSVPCFKRGVGIDLHKDTLHLKRGQHGEFLVSMNLLSLVGRREFGLRSPSVEAIIKVADNRQREIFNRVLLGDYALGSCQLIHHKHKWLLQLRYKFECDERHLNPHHVLAVRMGTTCPVCIACNHSLQRISLKGEDITAFRKRLMARYSGIISQNTVPGNGHRGHGKIKRLETLYAIKQKIFGFEKSLNHKYSRFIVEQAVLNGCGIIQMEAPRIIPRKTRFLGNWAYFDLKRKIDYKAQQQGIRVICLDTSDYERRCHRCGRLNSKLSISGTQFQCESCGLVTTVDDNAVQNLSLPCD